MALKGVWTAPKIIMSLSVPIFFIVLIIAAWKKLEIASRSCDCSSFIKDYMERCI